MYLTYTQAAFVIPDCYKDYCLSRAEESLRQWKVNVSRYHLYVNKNTGEIKSHPPKAYPNITQAHWDSFKEYRGSEKFKALNKKNRENIAKKKSIFYGSRGGYRLVKETLVSLFNNVLSYSHTKQNNIINDCYYN
ncbi:hypothetical protein RND81_12G104000 [Saponaria officinalis]|uniref:Transposase n=1 Tax=Saponaria officinalis TaxID=3572 RepID=A0AAW1H8W3_SAPOF